MQITSSYPLPPLPCVRMAIRIPNRMSIAALVSSLGRKLTVAFPGRPASILPFLQPIQSNPEHFSRLGSATYFAPLMQARAGNASMYHCPKAPASMRCAHLLWLKCNTSGG